MDMIGIRARAPLHSKENKIFNDVGFRWTLVFSAFFSFVFFSFLPSWSFHSMFPISLFPSGRNARPERSYNFWSIPFATLLPHTCLDGGGGGREKKGVVGEEGGGRRLGCSVSSLVEDAEKHKFAKVFRGQEPSEDRVGCDPRY